MSMSFCICLYFQQVKSWPFCNSNKNKSLPFSFLFPTNKKPRHFVFLNLQQAKDLTILSTFRCSRADIVLILKFLICNVIEGGNEGGCGAPGFDAPYFGIFLELSNIVHGKSIEQIHLNNPDDKYKHSKK